ncbi:hypothetical protein ALC62_05071 [Cyphomyrmex costatus]|uniref:Uncharacterized protein n=1 Tax=Cyphomyrmex costatus TaxID=456900 RepID=A0A195CUH0_9HYME|nr:hypothetical protein ALC62_05071 [Cyphomyrmex costatus]
MRYGPAYRGARMPGRSNVFPGHAFDRHNGALTIKLRTRSKNRGDLCVASNRTSEVSNSILFCKQYFENCRLNVGVHLYLRIERNNERSTRYLEFRERIERCRCSTAGEIGRLRALQNDLHYNRLCIRERRSMRSKRHYLCMRRNYNNCTIMYVCALRIDVAKRAWMCKMYSYIRARTYAYSYMRVSVFLEIVYRFVGFPIGKQKGVDGARRSRGFTLFQYGAPSCRLIALVMDSVDNSSLPQDKISSLFHIKPGFLVEHVALLVGLEFPHLLRSHRLLDTSEFTQYIDRHSKPARPVRSQSFISFSLRSSLVL